jgi:Holliday junction DNA helicase RuvB
VVVVEDLFNEIYGCEDVKQLFQLSIRSVKPIHILLSGPPASGKTLFLMSLLKFPNSKYYLGGQTSKAGLTEILLREKPEYLIIDELDKMNCKDYDALLSLMETGRVVRCKMRLWAEEQLNTKVYGACNYVEEIPQELLSRFLVVEFKEYSREEFINVSKHVLKVREGLSDEEAEAVSDMLADLTRDVRDSVKAGRLLKAGAPMEMIRKLFRRGLSQKTLF